MRPLRMILDLLSAVVFVAIGRSDHHHGVSVAGLASTLWPFFVGLLVGWLVLLLSRRSGASLADGEVVAVASVIVGMTLRVVSGQGTAFAFIVVATAFLSAFMLGWRLVMRRIVNSRL